MRPRRKAKVRTLPRSLPSRLLSTTIVSAVAVGLAGWTLYAHHLSTAANPASPPSAAFLPTISNPEPAPDQLHQGMVWIPGGEFSMGAADPPERNAVGMQATEDSRPIHRVYVD